MSATLIVVGSSGPFGPVRGALSDLLAPVRAVGDTISEPFRGAADSVTNRNALRDENEDLRRRLIDAQSRIAVADDALRERRELLAMSGLQEITGIRTLAARVATSPIDNFDATIEIDRGSGDGVRAGMPVAAGLGLVGTVTATTPKSARVRLFTDGASAIGVRHATSGDVGVIRGDGPGKPMTVSLIDPATEVRTGDVFVTSGLANARFPAGLAVASVVAAEWEQGKLEQTVTVTPFAPLDSLTFVSVVLWDPPPPVPFEAAPLPTVVPTPTTVAAGEPATSTAPRPSLGSAPAAGDTAARPVQP